jgi:chemotaxis methyl-accepting protein methylase
LQCQPSAVTPDGAQAAVFLSNVKLWKKSQVTVAITNLTADFLDKWNLEMETILEWANMWRTLQEQQSNHVPEFVDHIVINRTRNIRGADIIVQLNGNNNYNVTTINPSIINIT